MAQNKKARGAQPRPPRSLRELAEGVATLTFEELELRFGADWSDYLRLERHFWDMVIKAKSRAGARAPKPASRRSPRLRR